MTSANDKRIAIWLGISIATFYRWRNAGLLPRRPKSQAEADVMLRKIEQARDDAAFTHPRHGRVKLAVMAQNLSSQP